MLKFFQRKLHNLISDKKFSEILIGSAWALSFRVLATGLGLVSSIIIARCYGADMLGIVAVVDSFFILATTFTVLGTNTSILRLIPEHLFKYSPTSAFKIYRKIQYMVMGVSVATGALFFFSSNLIANKVFSKPHLSYYLALASVFIVFKSMMLLNTQAVRGLRLIRVFALMLLLPQAFNLLALIVLGLTLRTTTVPVYALILGYSLTGITGWFVMEYAFKKRLSPLDAVHPMPAREILSMSLPMLMTQAMVFIIGQTGVIMLGMFRSDAEVGYYAIAVKLATLTAFILQAINSMAGPKFSELFHSDKIDELFHVAKKSAKLIFWTTFPILLGFVVFGKLILNLAFGAAFGVAYPALVFLVIGEFVNSISGATGLFMNMTGHQIVLRNIMLIAAGLNIGINILLIPGYGIYGAAVAAMSSLMCWNITTLVYMKMKFGKTTGYFPIAEFL